MRGYDERFGFYAINITDPLRERTPKMSVGFLRNVSIDRFVEAENEEIFVVRTNVPIPFD